MTHRSATILATAIVLGAVPAAAQQFGRAAPAANIAEASRWTSYKNEFHIVGRVLGGVGVRLYDPFGAGPLAPPFLLGQVGALFINVGPLRMGPSLGGQLGFDFAAPLQGTLQPGWMALMRPSSRLGIGLRVDVPILFTRGAIDPSGYINLGPFVSGQSPVLSPSVRPSAVSAGIELGGSIAYYLLSGFALTGELSFSTYFGDSSIAYPVLGVGLGVVIDTEILP